MWDEIRSTIVNELSDIPDAAGVTRVCMRLMIAAILGGILGWERESRGKSAGLRTHILVALGSAMFVLVPKEMGTADADMTRVLQGLVAGVGFLGAGAIVKGQAETGTSADPQNPTPGKASGENGGGEVRGLTTAAGIWMTAAIGMAAGMGRELTAILSTLLALVVLALLPKVFDLGTKKPRSD